MESTCPKCACTVALFDGQETVMCPRCGAELSAEELDRSNEEQTQKFAAPAFLSIAVSLVAPGLLMLVALLEARMFSPILAWVPTIATLQIFFIGTVISAFSALHVAYKLGDQFGGVGRLAGIALCPVILVGNFIVMVMTSAGVR